MEFKEFAKHYKRMCNTYHVCDDCPLHAEFFKGSISSPGKCLMASTSNPETAERIINRWADEHPIVTNWMKFREVFGRDIRQSAGVTRLAWISGITNDSEKTVNEWLNAEYELPKESE